MNYTQRNGTNYSGTAHQNMKDLKFNKETILPLTEDLQKLTVSFIFKVVYLFNVPKWMHLKFLFIPGKLPVRNGFSLEDVWTDFILSDKLWRFKKKID